MDEKREKRSRRKRKRREKEKTSKLNNIIALIIVLFIYGCFTSKDVHKYQTIDSYYDFLGLSNNANIELHGFAMVIYDKIWFNPNFNVGCSGESQMDWLMRLVGESDFYEKIGHFVNGYAMEIYVSGLYLDPTIDILPNGSPYPSMAISVLYVKKINKIRSLSESEFQNIVKKSPCPMKDGLD